LKNGRTLEKAAAMANHASTRTTQLYDRRRDEVSLDEVKLPSNYGRAPDLSGRSYSQGGVAIRLHLKGMA